MSAEESLEQFYEDLDMVVNKVGKGGLGEVNEAGERCLNFCLDHEFKLKQH